MAAGEGLLSVVGTPIGNLSDVSPRVIETLRSSDVILCEDTRVTARLLAAFDIHVALQRADENVLARKVAAALERIAAGEHVSFVSDAGMPVISDPGNAVCRVLKEREIPYTVAPGANAALSALILSGLPADRFTFVGFLPDKAGEKKKLLQEYASAKTTLLFHCAPQDVDKDVAAMAEVFGNRRACAVREITKIHEESRSFLLQDGLEGEKRGEYVLVVEGAPEGENELCSLSETEHIRHYMNLGYDKKEALKLAAKDRGVSKSILYPFALELK